MKRLLSCNASDFMKMRASELKEAILSSEGRTICSEIVVTHEPVIHDITNLEVAKAVGADLILLNLFDCLEPLVLGINNVTFLNYAEYKKTKKFDQHVVKNLKKLICRPVGVNLEPVGPSIDSVEEHLSLPPGRICSKETLQAVQTLGFDFICLTGNPDTGVTNEHIAQSIKLARENFEGLVIAGKMHSAGVNEPIITKQIAEIFINNGADVILIPAVGTIPGINEIHLKEIIDYAKSRKILTMSAIRTSQESSQPEIIRMIALKNKILGVDIQHIGDSGYNGMANIENIFEMSLAIRGMRHTLSMISRSIIR